MKQPDMIIVGDIVNTHGLKGEVKILSDSDFKTERFVKGNKFYILNKQKEIIEQVILEHYRTHKNFDLLTFLHKPTIQDVEHYKGLYLAIKKENARLLEEDEGYYHAEILACDIYNQHDEFIGNVYKIANTPAYDLWYIKRKQQKDLILPFTDNFVLDINVEDKKIVVNLIEGME